MLQTMAYYTPYIKKKPTKNIDKAVSLHVLAQVIVEGILSFYQVQS